MIGWRCLWALLTRILEKIYCFRIALEGSDSIGGICTVEKTTTLSVPRFSGSVPARADQIERLRVIASEMSFDALEALIGHLTMQLHGSAEFWERQYPGFGDDFASVVFKIGRATFGFRRRNDTAKVFLASGLFTFASPGLTPEFLDVHQTIGLDLRDGSSKPFQQVLLEGLFPPDVLNGVDASEHVNDLRKAFSLFEGMCPWLDANTENRFKSGYNYGGVSLDLACELWKGYDAVVRLRFLFTVLDMSDRIGEMEKLMALYHCGNPPFRLNEKGVITLLCDTTYQSGGPSPGVVR